MKPKTELKKNLTELVRLASQDGASGLVSYGILVMQNGSIEAWLHGKDGNYGCWSLGERGEVVTELNMSREELLNIDLSFTSEWIEQMITTRGNHGRRWREPIEIYLGGELLAVRTMQYVMVSESFVEIRPTFSSDDCAFGFHRVRHLDGKEDHAGIMESIFNECLSYMETHQEAVICVADPEDISVFSAEHLPLWRAGGKVGR